MPELLHTALVGLPPPRVGKVREVYDLGESLLIVATDRISAFDVVMANGIPDKGRILNQMSAFWFDRLKEICPNHVISVDD
ncbi:MAG TPA: phosphoribosylaminoimidazolesuccinocarboxamide synthase, partial [Fimbriimonadaceae bacterium]|nr:phosphoribosylaminoimidazolesuccinocarboxamide synthase [Fimbriimonadaceae bacterium]